MKKLVVLAVLILALSASIAGAAAFQNGGFDNPTNYVPVAGYDFMRVFAPDLATITGWSVDTGNVDWVRTYWTADSPEFSVDLNGSTTGKISQTFTVVGNQQYLVEFALATNPDGPPSVKALVADPGSHSFLQAIGAATHTNMGWTIHSFSFTTAALQTSATLSFESQVLGDYGAVIDSVSVKAVPEASTLIGFGSALLMAGPGMIGWLRRRRS